MIRIIADTTCSIPLEQLKAEGIVYLPQIIVFGEESYRDDTEIDSATFIRKLKESTVLPKTSAPPPSLYTPFYREFIANGDTIIVICPSAEVSGTLRGATGGAEEFPGADIRIIDARIIAGNLGSIVLQAARWAKEGIDADTLVQKIHELAARERTYFLVDTLEFLYKGGRIGGAQALFGSILQVKPILTFRNGRADTAETQRTKKRAEARLKEMISAECPHGPQALLSVSHSDAPEDAKRLANDLSALLGIPEIPIYELPPAIVVHAGPKTLAVGFFTAA